MGSRCNSLLLDIVARGDVSPAILLGRALNHRMHGEAFLKYIYAGLALIGAVPT